MAHFAKIENNTVTEVIVIANEDCNGGNFPESEKPGQDFIASLGIQGTWLQTSYNNNFRKRYAGIGMEYNQQYDAFISQRPLEGNWILNTTTLEWEEQP